ncbi:alpha/beta fold hydrolase [Pseudomonas sp. S31]|uniref:alpha/beta fold hydrolase n=1 Tax=Pseudomonas sp. S31 TaxID=1564473 RepID=UPI001913B8B2|nr:alpha/beta hydrolase [Pseudomonas sp. S31]
MAAQELIASHATTNIAYSVQGSGPLVVLIASLGRGTAEFDTLAKRLVERGYLVALPEPRGIGRSSGPMENISLHDLANDYASVITAQGSPAIVAGHAYGQWVARTLATDHPELVRGTVLIAAGSKQWPRELLNEIATINDPAAHRDQKIASLRVAFFAVGNDPQPWLEGWHPAVARSQLAAEKRTAQDHWWAGGSAPILDLQADTDPFRPEASRLEMKEQFGARVTVRVVPNSSHALPAEKPLQVADAIADWADQLDR